MMDGIAALHATNATYYQIHSVSASDPPPAATADGVIYEYDRGNPGWWEKYDMFQLSVSNGWRYPLIHIAMNKLCFIDSGAILDWSTDYVDQLESAYPETLFVHATMPLTTIEDGENYNRNVYNDGMRDWCRTNNRVLFDIADMESHNSNGVPQTFNYNQRVCQELNAGYALDEGHLNSQGGQLVAKGFYALAAALLSVDRDGDGLSDGQELLAGTRPGDSQSVFKFINATATALGTVVLHWNSSSNRLYTLQRGANPGIPSSFTNVLLDVPATPPANAWTDTVFSAPSYYRVSVRQ
jgi:hypothetical protein